VATEPGYVIQLAGKVISLNQTSDGATESIEILEPATATHLTTLVIESEAFP